MTRLIAQSLATLVFSCCSVAVAAAEDIVLRPFIELRDVKRDWTPSDYAKADTAFKPMPEDKRATTARGVTNRLFKLVVFKKLPFDVMLQFSSDDRLNEVRIRASYFRDPRYEKFKGRYEATIPALRRVISRRFGAADLVGKFDDGNGTGASKWRYGRVVLVYIAGIVFVRLLPSWVDP